MATWVILLETAWVSDDGGVLHADEHILFSIWFLEHDQQSFSPLEGRMVKAFSGELNFQARSL